MLSKAEVFELRANAADRCNIYLKAERFSSVTFRGSEVNITSYAGLWYFGTE